MSFLLQDVFKMLHLISIIIKREKNLFLSALFYKKKTELELINKSFFCTKQSPVNAVVTDRIFFYRSKKRVTRSFVST